MSLHRRDFLRTCAVAAMGVSACGRASETKGQAAPPVQSASSQVPRFTLSAFGEPDEALQHWGTTTFGNWRTLCESRKLEGRTGYGIFLPGQPVPIEIVQKCSDVRLRVEALLASGKIPVNTQRIPVWE